MEVRLLLARPCGPEVVFDPGGHEPVRVAAGWKRSRCPPAFVRTSWRPEAMMRTLSLPSRMGAPRDYLQDPLRGARIGVAERASPLGRMRASLSNGVRVRSVSFAHARCPRLVARVSRGRVGPANPCALLLGDVPSYPGPAPTRCVARRRGRAQKRSADRPSISIEAHLQSWGRPRKGLVILRVREFRRWSP